MRPYLLVGAPDWVSLAAFAQGLDLIGRPVVWGAHGRCDLDAVDPAAIVIDGMRAGGAAIVQQAKARGIPTIVIDNGFMRRVHTQADNETGHYYVGLGGLGWSPANAPDRARFASLGIAIKAREARPDAPALICAQVPGDASHGLAGMRLAHAYQAIVNDLKPFGGAVWFRPHPLGFVCPPVGAEPRMPAVASLGEDLAAASVCISLNSNAGLEALMAGVPAITVLDSHYRSLAYRWRSAWAFNPRALPPPHPEAVEGLCARLAWAQWTAAEMRAGLPQRWLLEEKLIP